MILKKISPFLFSLILFFYQNSPVLAKEIKILITPFDVSNAGSNQYLASAIPQILISRMNKTGEILISEAKLSSLKDNKKQQEDFSAIMNFGRKNNADYIITGKVVAAGKNNNIDIFLFNTSTNQPESHFDYNSDNLNDLIPRLDDFSKSSVNLIKYIEVSEEKLKEKKINNASATESNKPVLVAPASTEGGGVGEDSYRVHPDKLIRSGKAHQQIIDERKKTIIQRKERTSEEIASRPSLKAPSEQVEEKKQGVLSKIGVNLPSEKVESEKVQKAPDFFIEKQKLLSNVSLPDSSNSSVDSSRPVLLSPSSSKPNKSPSFYLPYFNKKDVLTSHSGLPFPSPEELKPVGKIKKDDEPLLLKPNDLNTKIKPAEKKQDVQDTSKVKKSPESSSKIIKNDDNSQKSINKEASYSSDNNKKTSENNSDATFQETMPSSEKTTNNSNTSVSNVSEKKAKPNWEWF